MVCEDVLKVKNLPKELSDAEKEDFLKHFGAIKVKIITSKSHQKSVAFARFESKEVAREVLFRLHQAYVLKNRLCVEYAIHDIGLPTIKKVDQTSNTNKEHFKTFISKLNSFNSSVAFQQPPPPHLKYMYPKANRLTINNIGHALASVPNFYTQVLHLMNRMNLPPPFAVPDPVRQRPPQAPVQQQKSVNPPSSKPSQSSSESELESDEESKPNKEIIPQKRTLPQKKMVKRPKFIKPMMSAGPSSTKTEKPEDVFEKTDMHSQKKIELKVPTSSLESRELEKPEHVGTIPSNSKDCQEIEEKIDKSVISTEELTANQIPEKDLDVLPVFKNYHAGAPTCRLYIKNIAKDVELKDLEYIYNRYRVENKEDINPFDIRLMKEGRMKGQAFVTLHSIEFAQKALKETNGYILKDKPLVVVFARTAPKK